ncbi:MAG: molybdate ABC transporter substrate-binding protein [Pseudomonadales bacterium]|nr:molybdate ABC transporter substrate-binding protein [Pseudomonadales bacterium]
MQNKAYIHLIFLILLSATQNAMATKLSPSLEGDAAPTTISVAVASNFTVPMKLIVQNFKKKTRLKVKLSFSSSGKLYAQIRNHAPYHLFLSADTTKPIALEEQFLTVKASRFTYAIGTLALWSPNPEFKIDDLATFHNLKNNYIAIANPKIAPYGAAAVQVLKSLKLYDALNPKLIRADNVAQAFQFVSTHSAFAGFVSLSQLRVNNRFRKGFIWVVPQNKHSPIRQDAVLLLPGKSHKGAIQLMRYLQSVEAKKIMGGYGYRLP